MLSYGTSHINTLVKLDLSDTIKCSVHIIQVEHIKLIVAMVTLKKNIKIKNMMFPTSYLYISK